MNYPAKAHRCLAGLGVCILLLALAAPNSANSAELVEPERTSVRKGTAQMVMGETGSGSMGGWGPFGDHWVRIENNAKVDSYDSRIGPYRESKSEDATVGCNANPNDSLAKILLNNNAKVLGSLRITTPEEEGDIILQNNAKCTDEILYSQPHCPLSPLTMPAWFTEPGGGPSGSISGKYGSKVGCYEITNNEFRAYNNAKVTIGAGRYHFDKFELRNNVQFELDANIPDGGLVEIYVGNTLILENNSVVLPPIKITGDSTKLRIYYNGTKMADLSNNVTFYGYLYAPKAEIYIKNNDKIYGNLVGKSINLQENAGVHFDKALLEGDFSETFIGGIPALPPRRTNWSEIVE